MPEEHGSQSIMATPTAGSTSRAAVILPPTGMSFHRIAGLPLIARAALSALRAGFQHVVAMGGAEPERVRAVLGRDARTRAIPVVSGSITDAVRTQRVVLIPSDVLVTPGTMARVYTAAADGRPLLFHPEDQPNPARGIMLITREDLASIDGAAASYATAVSACRPLPVSLDGEICLHVCDTRTVKKAEDELVARVIASSTETDGPIAHLDRAVSTRLSRLLVRTPLRPNHITIGGTTIGLLGALSLAQGTYLSALAGTLLFWLAVIIDGCDGEVARLTFRESRFGHVLDIVTDNVVHVAIFVGLALGQYRAAPDQSWYWLIAILLGGFALAMAATFFCLVRHPPVARLEPRSRRGRMRQRLLRGFEVLMNRDFAYLLVLLALVGRLDWFLWGAAFGVYVYAAGLFAVYRWQDAE